MMIVQSQVMSFSTEFKYWYVIKLTCNNRHDRMGQNRPQGGLMRGTNMSCMARQGHLMIQIARQGVLISKTFNISRLKFTHRCHICDRESPLSAKAQPSALFNLLLMGAIKYANEKNNYAHWTISRPCACHSSHLYSHVCMYKGHSLTRCQNDVIVSNF